MTNKYRFDFGSEGWKDCVLASDYNALVAEMQLQAKSLEDCRDLREGLEARVAALEAFAKRVADSDMTGGAPAYVLEARKLLHSAPETKGDAT